jgi:hypothetical protein
VTKDEIQKIRFDIEADGQSALSMALDRDGTIARQGNGDIPARKQSVLGMSDGSVFRQLIEIIDEGVLDKQGIFDHPNKQGMPIKYTIAFLGPQPNVRYFEFRLGTESKDVGDLLPYFDNLIQTAVRNTESWFVQATNPQPPPAKPKPWWKVW